MPKDLNDLLPDEAYAVRQMREAADPLRSAADGRPILCCGIAPICTWDGLFRLLGKGVIQVDPAANRGDRYYLTEEWRVSAENDGTHTPVT